MTTQFIGTSLGAFRTGRAGLAWPVSRVRAVGLRGQVRQHDLDGRNRPAFGCASVPENIQRAEASTPISASCPSRQDVVKGGTFPRQRNDTSREERHPESRSPGA